MGRAIILFHPFSKKLLLVSTLSKSFVNVYFAINSSVFTTFILLKVFEYSQWVFELGLFLQTESSSRWFELLGHAHKLAILNAFLVSMFFRGTALLIFHPHLLLVIVLWLFIGLCWALNSISILVIIVMLVLRRNKKISNIKTSVGWNLVCYWTFPQINATLIFTVVNLTFCCKWWWLYWHQIQSLWYYRGIYSPTTL